MSYVDNRSASDHVAALLSAGMSQLQVAAEADVNRETLRALSRRRWCHSRVRDALLAIPVPEVDHVHEASAPELLDGRWIVRRGVLRWEVAL